MKNLKPDTNQITDLYQLGVRFGGEGNCGLKAPPQSSENKHIR